MSVGIGIHLYYKTDFIMSIGVKSRTRITMIATNYKELQKVKQAHLHVHLHIVSYNNV